MSRQRIKTGLLLGGAMFATIFFMPPWGVFPVLFILTALALIEFYALLDAGDIPHFKVVGVICGLGLLGAAWFSYQLQLPWREDAEAALLFFTCAFIFIRQITHTATNRPWSTMAGTLLGVMYVAFLMNFLVKLLTVWGESSGRMLVLFLIIVVKFTDIGAYFTGCAIGRHKLIPRISPAKTWEGCIGGVISGMLTGLLVVYLLRHFGRDIGLSLGHALAVGLLLTVAGIIGDLIESQLKRAAGVKDSGTFLRGMGGILDVLDSLLFAAPVLYIYLRIMHIPVPVH